MRLTDIQVRNLKAPEKGAKVYYDDTLKGFGVRVSQAGTKAFILATGKNRDRATIGRYPHISLQDARREAQRLIGERASGKHQPPKTGMEAALDLFTEQHLAKLAPRTSKEIARLFTKHLAKMKTKKLGEVSTHDITGITDKLAPSEAEHLHRACKTFFRWCVRRRMLQHSPLEGLELPSKWKPRERVLSDDELRAVWTAAGSMTFPFREIVKLLALTGQRRGEIASLKAEWIAAGRSVSSLPHKEDQTGSTPVAATEKALVAHLAERPLEAGKVAGAIPSLGTICLPSTITKNKRQHTFPIGVLATSILKSLDMTTMLIFSARGKPSSAFNGWSKAKAQLDKKVDDNRKEAGLQPIEPWTLHDLRRTYCTNLQRLGIKLEVIEALVNHVSGTRSGIVGVYQRHRFEAEMREAVDRFEKWFTKAILQQ